MNIPSGLHFIDGLDMSTAFGLVILNGATRFLEIPPKKDSIVRDWQDGNGIDVDLTHYFFAHREVPLQVAIIAPNEAEFVIKRDLLMKQLQQPGLRRLSFKATGQRSFYVFFKTSTSWAAVEPLKGSPAEGLIMYTFTMVFVEPNPSDGAGGDVFIVDDEGRFLIT